MSTCSSARMRAATILEIVVLVAITLVLAAAVTPRFAAAGDLALRDALRTQVIGINRAVESYRADHDDAAPALGGDRAHGWHTLLSLRYISEAPVNALLKTPTVVMSEKSPPLMDPEPSGAKTRTGWFYSMSRARVVANGFDHLNGVFYDESGYDPPTFAW